ncbi:hypothetical protein T459_29956 [Capsicum annuum]|uniref:Ubiquitin-like protease family profile domain-containing protein n=1 Tax=Capsicum annuum TaxID=4072 RepID=A0A2G2Y7I5_CAPAN|nr:hypothetical protein T459_29956 [Capsicum annuum]
MEFFRATTITRKIILEGGLIAVDDGSGSGSGVAVGANNAPLTVFETTTHYDYDHIGCIDFSPDFATSSECFACKCQDCKPKHYEVINDINALTASIKEMTSNRGVISSKRISYPYTPLEIKVDVTVEATTEEHNITVDNPSTNSNKEEKVEPVSLGERKNYPFEGFNISDEAPIKLTQLINDYSELIADGMLKNHAGRKQKDERYKVNESSLGSNMFDFVVTHPEMKNWFYFMSQTQTCWNDEVLAVVVLKERRIQVYDSISQRKPSRPSSEIQKLAKILPTYLDISIFLDQKVRTDWSMIEEYRDKMANPFDVQYVEGIAQQTIGSLDCSLFVAACAEYLSDGLQVPNNGLDAGLLHKRYASLL